MSARQNLHAAIVIAAARGRCNEEGIAHVLDAYRDEVLREAAEKIRKDPLCTKPAHRDYYADLIDPDKDAS